LSRPTEPRPLGSTYRLQLNGIGFVGARNLVGYLHALGVETLYVSPVLAAAAGSTHGYDVVDPTRLDPTLGTAAELEALLAELDDHEMRLLLDVVPNHMATEPDNPWWWDSLRLGQASPFSSFFDIDWSRHDGKVLLARLSAPLASRGAALHMDPHRMLVSIDGQRFPLAPGTLGARSDHWPDVLVRQHYRLAFWNLGRTEGNYRRFFDIDGLIGLRIEDPAVYEATHRFVLGLARDPRVAGLRIDHVDGLTDPAGYLCRLGTDLTAGRVDPAHLIVEKILGDDERLPAGWPVDGASGYEFLDVTTRLFVDPAGSAALAADGGARCDDRRPFEELALEAKRLVLDALFAAELDRLAALARRALASSDPGNDLALSDLRRALGELTAHLDVYRTYGTPGALSPSDRTRLRRVCAKTRDGLVGDERRALDAVVRLLLTPDRGPAGNELLSRWQQLSGAVAAKGVEDTACYCWPGLLSTADVGSSPGRPSVTVAEFHRTLSRRGRLTPGGLNALSTHDTKRSADVRARLSVLSEIPQEWSGLLDRWHRRLAPAGEAVTVDPRDELICYQSLVGLWPAAGGTPSAELRARIQAAMRKAAREAKSATSWALPDLSYERALADFVDRVVSDERFSADAGRLLRRIGPASATNSLAMTVLAATAPGVPDIYQGTELWDLSLMDPDNRRPVDFARRAAALSSLSDSEHERGDGGARELLQSWTDGRVKLFVTKSTLQLRRASPALFSSGRYIALDVIGPRRRNVVAFARRRGLDWVVVVVPRLAFSVAGPGRFPLGRSSWLDTAIALPRHAPSSFVDAASGSSVSVNRNHRLSLGAVLSSLPVAVLRNA
jgi:(1->4)-alpha-D-glucan 1-alpha-D-glucosylmutase